jgi:hypothetical protein
VRRRTFYVRYVGVARHTPCAQAMAAYVPGHPTRAMWGQRGGYVVESFKDKLNARAKLAKVQDAEEDAAARTFEKRAPVEYVRLLNELCDLVEGVMDGVDEAKVTRPTSAVELTRTVRWATFKPKKNEVEETPALRTFARVEAPTLKVTFLGRRSLTFAGVGLVEPGSGGRIEVQAKSRDGAGPFPGGILMASPGPDHPWELRVPTAAGESVPLTQELLEERLEAFFASP